MDWGMELWDQLDILLVHTQKGTDLCERVSQFTKERCAIEIDYANKLKKLVKSFMPKKKEEEDELPTHKCFYEMIKEIYDIAGQHETISEELQKSCIGNEWQSLIHELKQERKKVWQENSKLQTILQAQFTQLDKAKKLCEKAFRELEKAHENYSKAQQDLNLSRAEVEKMKQTTILRQQCYEQSQQEYAAEVQKTINTQNNHYQVLMPQVFKFLQLIDEKRIVKMKEFVLTMANTERNTIPIIKRCVDGMIMAADLVDSNQEMQMVVDKYKTGFSIPSDVPFENISNNSNSNSNSNSTANSSAASAAGTNNYGTATRKDRRRLDVVAKDDFSHLPPSQQKRQLNIKIESLKSSLAKETSERDGLTKLKDCYDQQPSLGDRKAVAKQLEENDHRMNLIRQELLQFEEYLATANKRLGNEVGGGGGTLPLPNTHQQLIIQSKQAPPSSPRPKHLVLIPQKQQQPEQLPSPSQQLPSPSRQQLQEPIIKRSTSKQETLLPSPKRISALIKHTLSGASNKLGRPATPTKTKFRLSSTEDCDGNCSSSPTTGRITLVKMFANAPSTKPSSLDSALDFSQQSFDDDFDDDDDDNEVEALPSTSHKTCTALYAYDGSTEGSVSMKEGELFKIVAADEGDGWVKVEAATDGRRGFVPATYITCNDSTSSYL